MNTISWNSVTKPPEVTKGSGKNFLVAVYYHGLTKSVVNEAWFLNGFPNQVPIMDDEFKVAGVDTEYLTGWYWVNEDEEAETQFTKIEQPVVAWCEMPDPPSV